MASSPPIVFDFIDKTVVTGGDNADADSRVQAFLRQQIAQAATCAASPPR